MRMNGQGFGGNTIDGTNNIIVEQPPSIYAACIDGTRGAALSAALLAILMNNGKGQRDAAAPREYQSRKIDAAPHPLWVCVIIRLSTAPRPVGRRAAIQQSLTPARSRFRCSPARGGGSRRPLPPRCSRHPPPRRWAMPLEEHRTAGTTAAGRKSRARGGARGVSPRSAGDQRGSRQALRGSRQRRRRGESHRARTLQRGRRDNRADGRAVRATADRQPTRPRRWSPRAGSDWRASESERRRHASG